MIDLNDLRVFERVASLRSFSAASRALDLPKSSVSRSIKRLEDALATRLMQRTTREVMLTESGAALLDRCADLLRRLDQTIEYVGSLSAGPRGCLRVSAGIGFGVNVLADLLPRFLLLYPNVDVALDLSSQPVDLVADGIDVAIRMGPMPETRIISKRLGILHRYLCASPDYLARHGTPESIENLRKHDLIVLPTPDGSQPTWSFSRGGETVEHRHAARLSANCALTIHRLLVNGAGIGLSSGYLCVPEFEAGRLVRLLPEWRPSPVHVHAVFPTRRQLSPSVRAFIDFIAGHSQTGRDWQFDPIAEQEGVA